MIKRTIYIGNACLLKKKDNQLVIEYNNGESDANPTVPIEDVGLLIIDNPAILVSNALLMALSENNSAVINCDDSHLPFGLMLPMYSHHTFTEKLRDQIEASVPLKKNLWQQTVTAKIENQGRLLRSIGVSADKMDYFVRQVKSGDTTNVEARAAVYYWDNVFGEEGFLRHRYGEPPNNMLNYGYAVLRAIVARSLIGSGLFPTIGIFHRNKYNPYCLADDIMEHYRPWVDALVLEILEEHEPEDFLTPEMKRRLLQIPVLDVEIDSKRSPLMVGMQRTTASLAGCFDGSLRKILYPVFNEA